MSIIRDYARIKHHTITTIGATFSIPPQEDFTLGFGLGTTQSWSPTDLYVSEIGVNETDNKAFIRIGNSINEFSFIGSTSSIPSLDQVLSVGNTTGGSDIVVSAADLIKSPGGTTYLDIVDLNLDIISRGINIESVGPTASFTTVKINEYNFAYKGATTSNATPKSIATVSLPTSNSMINLKITINGLKDDFTSAYVGEIFGGYKNVGGTITQIGSGYSLVEYSDFLTATSNITIVGSTLEIRVIGEAATNIVWNASIQYLSL